MFVCSSCRGVHCEDRQRQPLSVSVWLVGRLQLCSVCVGARFQQTEEFTCDVIKNENLPDKHLFVFTLNAFIFISSGIYLNLNICKSKK